MIFTSLLKIIKIIINFKNDSYNVKKDNPDADADAKAEAEAEAGLLPKAEKL
jgi:hypothetical protein